MRILNASANISMTPQLMDLTMTFPLALFQSSRHGTPFSLKSSPPILHLPNTFTNTKKNAHNIRRL